MIQRKQTIYLLLALIAVAVCLCLQIGSFEPTTMGPALQMFNLFVVSNGAPSPVVWPLFALLVVAAPLILVTIFAYKNRKRQARLCVLNIVLCLAWVAVYAVIGWVVGVEKMAFRPELAAALPVVAVILLVMARNGILADERLVRAADRIR